MLLETKIKPEHKPKSAYKVGDFIDALKIDMMHRKICWSQAKIIELGFDSVKVGFMYDTPNTDR